MEKTLVTKLNVSVEEQGLEIFCRTLKENWSESHVGDDYFCTIGDVGGNGRTCIISAKEGDVMTFKPKTSDSTTAVFMPLSEMPENKDGSKVAATAARTNTSVLATNPLTYTIPAGTKYLIFYKAFSIEQSWNVYNISVQKNGCDVRIPDLDLW